MRIAAAKIAGVRKVLEAESDTLDEGVAEAYQALVVPLMANYDAVLTPATSAGKNIAPRLTVLKVTEPAKRVAGVKVESAAELVNKLKNEAGVI